MSPQKPRSGNKPLVLDELQIPGAALAHPPVAADTWGINIAAARLNFPHDGLKLIIPPWTPNMGVGDSYRIKINNFPVVLGSIEQPEEVDKDVMRYIAPGGLVDGAFDLSYDVTRVGGTPETSLTTKIYVKIDAAPPGGRDQDGDVPGHSELHLSIPAQFLPPGAVDKDDAAAGIPVTILPYPNLFDGDRIKLSWGGEIVWHRVTDLEATDPDNHPIVITVDEDTIRDADDTDSSGLVVAFEVYDVVDNQSDGWSAEVRVVVDTGSSRLIAPFIKEVRDMKLDMDELGDADLTFQVVALTADFAPGDQIEMRLSGTTVNGDKVDKPYPPELITNAPSIVEFTRPSADVRALIGGVHTAFSYRLIKADGSPDLFSKTFSPRVIGLSTLLAAPIALDEIAGTLDPDLPRTQVDIPWNDIMVPGNVIMLVWEGTTASGASYEPDLPLYPISDDEAGNTLEISVEGEHLKAIENGTLDLCYWLLSDAITRAAVGHKSLYAEQLRLGQPQVELPEPEVEGENGGVLDPADVPATGTRLIVRQYAGQIEEDVVHILWWGSVTGRYRNQIKLNSITDKIDVPFTIRKALVDDNRNGTVQAMYWVKRANGRTSASAVLWMSIGAAMDLLAPSVKQATGNAPSQQLNPVAAQDALTVVIPEYGIRPGDQVSVTWTGTAGEGSYVTPAQELPPNREIDLPVEVIAFNLGRLVTVTYTVIHNDNESPPSAPLNLTVQPLAEDDLQVSKPRITQAANSGEGPDLDVSSLTGNATVRIDGWPHIAVNQYVWLRLKGRKADNSVHDRTLWEAPSRVTQNEYDRNYLQATVPYDYLQELGDGSTLTVEFKVALGQSLEEDQATLFPLRTYIIRAALDLPAPSVKQATGTTPTQQLNPVSAQDALTVEIPNYNIQPGDQVRVTWAGAPGDGSHTTPLQILLPEREIPLPISLTAYNLGRSVTVTYTVTPRGGSESEPSGALTLNVQAIPDISLPMPLIPQAAQGGIGSELDLTTFVGNTRVTVAPWPLIAAGQRVWLRVEGTALDNSSYTITLYTASEVVPSEVTPGLSKALLRSELEKLRDGSALNVVLQVTFDRSSTQANAVDFPLRTYTLKAVALVAPTLTDIRDSKSSVVGGTTVETSVTVSGTGSSGQQIQLMNVDGPIGSPVRIPDDSTIWNTILTGLAQTVYNIRARALYGTGLPDSAAKYFTVTAVVNPTITDIRDTKGSVVGKTTVETSVTVTGTGSSGQQIQLMNGSANIGNPFTIPETGTTWSIPLTGLAPNTYSIKVKALYGTGVPDSAAKGFTVTELLKPAITNVRTSSGAEVPEGSVTDQVNVTLFGTASKAQSVEIFDVNTSKGTTDVNGSGNWSMHQNGMEQGFHSFTAKGLYGNNPVSDARTFTVQIEQPFSVGPRSISISGNGDYHVFLHPGWEHVGQLLAHHIYQVPVTGGRPPYYYQVVASNPERVANVNEYGQIYPGRSAGTATVRASDSVGNYADITVSITWVRQWEQAAWSVTKTQADSYVRQKGLTMPSRADLQGFYNAFSIYGANVCDVVGITNYGPSNPTCWFWEEAIHSNGKWWYRNLGNGSEDGIGLASMINSIGWRRSG